MNSRKDFSEQRWRHRRRGETVVELSVERRCRKQLAKCGLKLNRDRAGHRSASRQGQYRIVDASGIILIGAGYSWPLSRIEWFTDNITTAQVMPERVMIAALAKQQQDHFVGELRRSVATAHAAVERVQDQHRRADDLMPDARPDARFR